MIEQIGSNARDDNNAAAFAEAHKDLPNMLTDRNPKQVSTYDCVS